MRAGLIILLLICSLPLVMIAAEPPELVETLNPPDKYKVNWVPQGGLLNSPRGIGFVADKEYRENNIPLLRKYLNDPDPELRLRVALRLAELRSADGFEILLDAITKERRPFRRGGHHYIYSEPAIADRLISLIGYPDTYDPLGAPALRNAVIERWRREWKEHGQSFLGGLSDHKPIPGRQTLLIGETRITKEMDDMEEWYFLSGRRMYVIGAMDGTFPPLGRLLGDQNGIWAQPIKVMDGFEYAVMEQGQETWTLNGCQSFEHDFASCKFDFERNGLSVSRMDFVAENESAMFSTISIRNLKDRPREIRLQLTGKVNIRPAWGTALPNDLDVISYQNALIGACDAGMSNKWGVVFGADQEPSEHKEVDNKGILVYELDLPASGDAELVFAILAEQEDGVETARKRFAGLVRNVKRELAQKKRAYESKVLSGVQFDCSDEKANNAFKCAKANILMMTTDIPDCFDYPFLLAGIPDYAELFGCDSAYSTTGPAAAGFEKTALGTLKLLANFGRQQGGQIPHEVVSNGKIVSRGNVQETPQFIIACWKYCQWSGDEEFLKEIYPFCKQCMEFTLKNYDRDGDKYPEGQGLMERSDMVQENIDAACYVYGALEALADMAGNAAQSVESEKYRKEASDMKKRFNADWWNSKEKMWADCLAADGTMRMLGYPGVTFPMEVGIADPDKARIALTRVHGEWVNKWTLGSYRGYSKMEFNTCPFHNDILAIGAFNYGDITTAWERLGLTARVVTECGMLGAFPNTGPGADDIMQLWSAGPFLEAVITGLAGVHPVASENRVEVYPKLPAELSYYSLRELGFGDHILNMDWKRDRKRDILTFVHAKGVSALQFSLRIAVTNECRMTLNGEAITPKYEEFRGVRTCTVNILLPRGKPAAFSIEGCH